MRTTVIPAQVTTVEDTIAGNLTLTQIVLLVSSLFVNTFLYALLPKQLAFSPSKILLMLVVFCLCIALSIRIKGRLVIHWCVVLTAFLLRPHIYTFNKNTLFYRKDIVFEDQKRKIKKVTVSKKEKQITSQPRFDYQSVLRNTAINLQFKKNRILVVKNYD